MSVFDHSSTRFQQLISVLRSNSELDSKRLPGLASLLEDIVDVNIDVSREESVRRLLGVFWKSETDSTYSNVLAKHESEEESRIRAFVQDAAPATSVSEGFQMGPSLGAREELPTIDQDEDEGLISTMQHMFNRVMSTLTGEHISLYDDDQEKNKILAYTNEKFQNWGKTVENTPHLTFVPRTSYGVQQIVRYAKQEKMNVRASGYRHSWSPIFGSDKQIIISTLGLTRASTIPNLESLPGSQYFLPNTGLSSIDLVGTPKPGENRLVRVGTAVTNQQFRRWCNSHKAPEASTLPFNVIMVEITLGGSNAPICHGAGRRHKTLSDLVHTIEYVDANGNMQTLSKDQDPNFMKLAGGCFGLLGIVTHITLEVEPMSYAHWAPKKIAAMKAIPPPPDMKDSDIPEPLRIAMTPEERAAAQAEFEAHAKNDYYAEWFWYPYTSQLWVNCWEPTDDSTEVSAYPPAGDVFLQFAEMLAFQIIQLSDEFCRLQETFPWAQATFLSKMALYSFPDIQDPKDAIRATVPDTLHFRRAIQNVRVRDMEIEIPLQPKKGLLKDAKYNDDINWSLVQRAWWDAILMAYQYKDTCPQRMPLEMRITGSSDIIIAPFRGNTLGTCSIEILTLQSIGDPWIPYRQAVLDKWMNLKDNTGNYLNTRPHWAKEWTGLTVRGQPMLDYLKETYADSIVEFNDILGQIASRQGWTLQDQRERFSNQMFDQFFFGAKNGITHGEARETGSGTVNGKVDTKTNARHWWSEIEAKVEAFGSKA